jgi:hypothetical protein
MLQFMESGMDFSFADEESFYIEKCGIYERQLRNNGISSVECIVLHHKKICFIEAKSSAPSPDGEKGMPRFDEFLDEIRMKMEHSVQLCCAILHGVQPMDKAEKYKIGSELRKSMNGEPHIRFLLIVRKHKREWCMLLQEALRNKMTATVHLWKADVVVLNEEKAKEYKLIQ